VNSGRQLTRIRQDIAEGRQAGATGTPTFYVGFTPAAGKKMPVITMLSGAQPYSAFKQVIEAALLGKTVGSR
jgi:protein-disulfide isomerase